MSAPLGRRVPSDFSHVSKYGLRALLPATVATVERTLPLPPLRSFYDQGQEGACVGFGSSWALSIMRTVNTAAPKYDARWLYQVAQTIDEYADTPPEEGTSVRAALDVLRLTGARRIARGVDGPPLMANGISANRWATSVDEVRTAIAEGHPVVIGVNWYANFDTPVKGWIGKGELGRIRGGHCVCLYAASDRKQAVKIVNNWGMSYPLVWMPYMTLQRLLDEAGEAAVLTL